MNEFLDTQTIDKLVEEIKMTKLSGPGAAARLLQEGVDPKSLEDILRNKLNFFAVSDSDGYHLSVSIRPYEGELHPKIRDVNPNYHWMSELE